MPAPIVIANLTPATKMGNESPKVATRSDLRDGSRGDSGSLQQGMAPGVSGLFLEGQTLWLSAQEGFGFGSGAHTVEVFDDMRNGVAGQTQSVGDLPAGAGQYTRAAAPYSSEQHHSKGLSLKICDAGNYFIVRAALSGQQTSILASYWVFVPTGKALPGMDADGYSPGGSNWKMAWAASGPEDFGAGDGADMCLPTNNNSNVLTLGGNETAMNSSSQWTGYSSFPEVHTYGEWLWCCALLDSSLGAQRVLHLSKSKGLKRFERENIDIFGQVTKPYFSVLNYPGWIGSRDNSTIFYDDIQLISGSAAGGLVLIGDAPELANCSDISVQRVVSRSDPQIEFEALLGPFDSFSGKYLFVLDPKMQPVLYQGLESRSIA